MAWVRPSATELRAQVWLGRPSELPVQLLEAAAGRRVILCMMRASFWKIGPPRRRRPDGVPLFSFRLIANINQPSGWHGPDNGDPPELG